MPQILSTVSVNFQKPLGTTVAFQKQTGRVLDVRSSKGGPYSHCISIAKSPYPYRKGQTTTSAQPSRKPPGYTDTLDEVPLSEVLCPLHNQTRRKLQVRLFVPEYILAFY